MKSLFISSPFGLADRGFAGLRSSLGQDETDDSQIPDALKGVVADIGELINSLLGRVPDSVVAAHKAEFEECKADVAKGGAGLITGGQCLYNLFQTLKDEMQKTGEVSVQPVRTYNAPPPSSFPWVPVALGAGAGLLLIYALTR